MGILLDSTFLVAHERARRSAKDVFRELRVQVPDQAVALSTITVMEMMHGIQRSDTPERAARSQRFLDEALLAVDVEPVTVEISLRAGRIDGLLTAQGNRVATSDLLIAATALELDYTVVTGNRRHFERVPGVRILLL